MSSGNASSPESPDNSSPGNSGVLGYVGITLFVGLAIYFACHYIKSILLSRDERLTSPLGTPGAGAVPDADNTRESRNRGLDIENISLLPTFPYQPIKRTCRNERHEHKEKVSTVECAVCLNELEEGEMVRVLPSCKHYFHVNCIDAWLSKSSSCPMCRAHPEPEKVRLGLVSISPPWRLLQSTSSERRQFSFRSCLGSPFIKTPSKSPSGPSDSPFQGSWQGSPTVMTTPPRDLRQTPPGARTPEISEIREIP